ncbi:MAG TPA: SCO family protein [Verrucomicrobiae bacterium]|nr:SCO family protein [Verrucomicrobiae bacterium]
MRSLFAAAAALIVAIAAVRGEHAGARHVELVDQLGRHFTLDDLRGRPLIVTFISAHCDGVCPLVEAQVAAAAQRQRADHGSLRFLTISLDPERDTHADLVRIARRFDADPSYWLIAGGQPDGVHRVMHAFGVDVSRGRDGYADAHTTFMTVLDGNGRVAGTLLPRGNV